MSIWLVFLISHLVQSSITVFADPLERLRSSATAKVPIIIGSMENDGSVFAFGLTNLTAFLEVEVPGIDIPPDFVRSLYPGQNDSLVISDSIRELVFRWWVAQHTLAVRAALTAICWV
jgi:hypothetical protein